MTKRPKGFFKGAEADARAGKASMSPGTHHGGGGRGGAPGTSTQATHIPTQPKQKTTTGDGLNVSNVGIGANILKGNYLSAAASWGAKKIGNIFQKKAQVPTLTEKTAAMEDAYSKKTYKDFSPAEDGANVAQSTIHPQSLVTAPTADKAAGFGHQWNFQAYGDNTQTATNPYDYTQAPYAKKGKMIRKYATGQEIKNFSKGKRFGPPPLKGPDSQGLQVILENSDYFKKLIG